MLNLSPPECTSENMRPLIVFLDTEHERNALMQHVYPKLRDFCQKKGYEFQVKLNNYVREANKIINRVDNKRKFGHCKVIRLLRF